MPRKAKGARLHWRERKDGPSVWEIRDTGILPISTRTNDRAEAEIQFEAYLARKRRAGGPVQPDEMTVSEALSLYGEEHAPSVADPARIGYAIEALDRFWGDLAVNEISRATCKRYVAGRGVASGTCRRELGVLQAAINFCFDEGYLLSPKKVHLPDAAEPTHRWLTRQEAAWLLRGARALNADGKHLADFIMHGLYTGSRKATILAMHIDIASVHGGRVDTVNGVLYRKPYDKKATKKRQGTSRIPPRYLAQLRRQAANGRRYVVERSVQKKVDGETVIQRGMVGDIRKGWKRAVEMAEAMAKKAEIQIDLTMDTESGRKPITPHVLKHTAITWALQKGATIWDAAGYFDTSTATIEKVYGHHSPDHQSSAVEAVNRRG